MTAKTSDRMFNAFLYVLLTGVFLVMVYPFWLVLVQSLNDSGDLSMGGVFLWPRVFSLDAYRTLFAEMGFLRPLSVSFSRTVLGMLVATLCNGLIGYALAHKDLLGRRFFLSFFVFTMYFSPGIIPVFLTIRAYGLIGSYWVYILPYLAGAYHIILMKTYFEQIPKSLEESAKMDGANDFTIFFRIILPVSMPLIATILIFIGVWQWNQWFDTYIYIPSRQQHLWTLQMHLVRVLKESEALTIARAGDIRDFAARQVTPRSIRMAITMVTTLPIVCIYPFFQRHFVKGVMLGSMKG